MVDHTLITLHIINCNIIIRVLPHHVPYMKHLSKFTTLPLLTSSVSILRAQSLWFFFMFGRFVLWIYWVLSYFIVRSTSKVLKPWIATERLWMDEWHWLTCLSFKRVTKKKRNHIHIKEASIASWKFWTKFLSIFM